MELDSRQQERSNVSFDVVLCYEGLGLIKGTAVNMSAHGLFVETDFASIPKGASVQAAFVCHAQAEPRHISLHGVVVRSTERGVAINFSNADAEECARILAQLSAPRVFSEQPIPAFL